MNAEVGGAAWSARDLLAVAALLHDAGKVMQRAGVECSGLRDGALKGLLCPTGAGGRPTHLHVVYSEQFLRRLAEALPDAVPCTLPGGKGDDTLANLGARHHRPGSQAQQVVAEADRLAAGTDREQRGGEEGPRPSFRAVPLRSLFADLRLADRGGVEMAGRQATPGADGVWHHSLASLDLAADRDALRAALFPQQAPAGASLPDLSGEYGSVWEEFEREALALAGERQLAADPRLLYQSLDALCARHWWSVPSSTVDEPDVSLYDHARVSAAFAVVLQAALESGEPALVGRGPGDRKAERYLLAAADLSGIQRSLFAIRSGYSRGAARLLRGRSLRIALLARAVAELLLDLTGGHPAQVLVEAGGRLLLLLPASREALAGLERARQALDEWSRTEHAGGLSVALAWEPAPGEAFLEGRYEALSACLGARLDEAKRRPLRAALQPGGRWAPVEAFVLSGVHDDYAERGVCPACGMEPAGRNAETRGRQCEEAHRAGGALVGAEDSLLVVWRRGEGAAPGSGEQDGAAARLAFFAGLEAELVKAPPGSVAALLTGGARVLRLESLQGASSVPLPPRLACRHVPLVEERHLAGRAAAKGEEELKKGHVLPFELLAEEALAEDDGRLRGSALLGVLKLDVDRLGQLLASGLSAGGRRVSVSRQCTLSRMLDWFFSVYLERLASEEAPASYTVYAGGDDALLVADWKGAIRLAATLQKEFSAFACRNPQVTLSAAVALAHPHSPLAAAVDEAQAGLEGAKQAGRDRVSLLADTVSWRELAELLRFWGELDGWLDGGVLTLGLVRRLLAYGRRYRRAVEGGSVRDLIYRAHMAYDISRNVSDAAAAGRLRRLAAARGEPWETLMRHLGVPVQMTLYDRRASHGSRKG